MKFVVVSGAVLAAAIAAVSARQAASVPPAWAYGVTPAGAPRPARANPPADDGSAKTLAGSTRAFTLAQLGDAFNVADWFPADHPNAPSVVLKGRAPDVRACGLCHYPNGRGRPENANIAGLPVTYVLQQMDDFKNGLRKSADTRKTNTNFMITMAKAMTDDEVKSAAEYFAAMPLVKWITVKETDAVPITRISGGMFVPLPGSETEPIGARIIEVPEFPDRTELRDPRVGFIAYVPRGAIKRGETIVKTGVGDPAVPCGVCHGPDLHGLGPAPGIAGMSPSYLVRQLFDLKVGARHGLWSPLMRAVVDHLSDADMLAVAAYTASLSPAPKR